MFLACEAEFLELQTPPVIDDAGMHRVFGRIPGTQNPQSITDAQLDALRELALGTGRTP